MNVPPFLVDTLLVKPEELRLVVWVCDVAFAALEREAEHYRKTLATWTDEDKRMFEGKYLRNAPFVKKLMEAYGLEPISELERRQRLREIGAPGFIATFGVVALAATIDEFLSALVAAAHLFNGAREGDLMNETARTMSRKFGDQLDTIQPLIDLRSMSRFADYSEVRASRNSIVHSGGFATRQYVRQAGSAARASDGQKLSFDREYLSKAFGACYMFVSEVDSHLQDPPNLC